jgi:hypothetical protein
MSDLASSSYPYFINVLAICFPICLTTAPKHSKLNEIAPVAPGAISKHGFVPYYNSVVRVFFHASASLLRQTAYFLPLAAPTGFGAYIK